MKTIDSDFLALPFGARYYQSTHSFWLSVDPLADKSPNLSPYAYCAGNPVKLVDEDGREIVDAWVKKGNGSYVYDSRVKTQADAEKYYGQEAEKVCIGYTYESKKGSQIMLGRDGIYSEDGLVKKATDQAPIPYQTLNAVKNRIKALDEEGHNDGANTGKSRATEAVKPYVMGAATINPLVGTANSLFTILNGNDIYGHSTTPFEKGTSSIGLSLTVAEVVFPKIGTLNFFYSTGMGFISGYNYSSREHNEKK